MLLFLSKYDDLPVWTDQVAVLAIAWCILVLLLCPRSTRSVFFCTQGRLRVSGIHGITPPNSDRNWICSVESASCSNFPSGALLRSLELQWLERPQHRYEVHLGLFGDRLGPTSGRQHSAVESPSSDAVIVGASLCFPLHHAILCQRFWTHSDSVAPRFAR